MLYSPTFLKLVKVLTMPFSLQMNYIISHEWYRITFSELHINVNCGEENEKIKKWLLKTNILYYTEHALSNYWFYDPIMELPMWDRVFPLMNLQPEKNG